jgi:acetyl esterase/lipase
MKPITLLLIAFLLAANGCSALRAGPSTPTPMPTFQTSKFGTADIDVTYCTMDGLPQMMDIYYPASGGPWPVVVYVHGGSWREGDKAEGAGWSYLNAQGFLVVSVNYRLATTEVKFPVMIEDVKCAIRYLRAHASEYNLDPDHIGAIGASAGGHLVALLGTSDESAAWDVGEYLDQSSRVQAVVSIAGLSDFTRDMYDGISMAIYFAFGQLPGRDDPANVVDSPVTYISPDDPPFLIFHGDEDGVVPLDQAQTLNERLVAGGIPSTLVVVQHGQHGLEAMPGTTTVPSQQEISDMILQFLVTNLR